MRVGESATSVSSTPATAPALPLPRLAGADFSAGGATLSVLTDPGVHAACGTRVAFSCRLGGTSAAPFDELDLSTSVGDDPAAVESNRLRLLQCLGAGLFADKLIVPRQVHGSLVVEVGELEATRAVVEEGTDGIICAKPQIPVLLCFADCAPVICVAPGGMFCVVHAGWRGALAGIAGIGLAKLSTLSGRDARECNCYIGPHIGGECYEVGPDVLVPFVDKYGAACEGPEGHLDLSAAVRASLLRAGASAERICDAGICTACNVSQYYSYRAEGGRTGRHGALAFRE